MLEMRGALQGAPPCQPPGMPVISRHLKGVHITGGSTWTGVRLPWLHTMIIVLFAEGEHSVDRAVDAVGIWIV